MDMQPPSSMRRHLRIIDGGSVRQADASGELLDAQQRAIRYIRISLTDRCNYRCTYCMPADGVDLLPRPDILSFEEIAHVVEALCSVGVRRVRLTGGEPTVRKDLVELVTRLSKLPLLDLSLSTNGERLVELAAPLKQAGLHRINVSLDTLLEERFAAVTRKGHLPRVLAGLETVREVGFQHTKVNAVAMRGFNDDELPALCRYAWSRGFVPRFIELMPMAEGHLYYPGTFLGAAEIRQRLLMAFPQTTEDQVPKEQSKDIPGVGPARYEWLPFEGALHPVGIISAISEPFCSTCNRVRLSATGALHTCLGRDDQVDLRSLLRSGLLGDSLMKALLDATRSSVMQKKDGHEFSVTGCGGPKKYMVSIGG